MIVDRHFTAQLSLFRLFLTALMVDMRLESTVYVVLSSKISNFFSMFLLSFCPSVLLQPVDELRTVVFEILKKKDEIQGSWPACPVWNHCKFQPHFWSVVDWKFSLSSSSHQLPVWLTQTDKHL